MIKIGVCVILLKHFKFFRFIEHRKLYFRKLWNKFIFLSSVVSHSISVVLNSFVQTIK